MQFVEISVVKSSGFWVQSWFSGLTWARLEFWPFFGPFRVQKIIFSFRKIFSQYSVPYRTRSPWNSEHSTSSTVPHRITHRQTHGITTKAYSFNDVKYTVFSIYLIRNHEHIADITYSPSIIYSLGSETKLGIPTLNMGLFPHLSRVRI